MSGDLVSIIIPVYGVEKYIEQCLLSIISQTYKELEIIFVDDATKDNSCEIINQYAANDKRIKLVHHEVNKGLFQARLTGIDNSTGSYIMFIDGDDSISCDWVRLLLNKIKSEQADVCLGDFVLSYTDGVKKYHSFDPIRYQDLNLVGEDVLKLFMTQHGQYYGWHTVWNKIYSRLLWTRILPRLKEFSASAGHLIMTEDIAFSSMIYSYAKKIVNVHNVYYYYLKSDDSSTSKVQEIKSYKKSFNDVKKVFTFFKDILVENGNYDRYQTDYEEWLKLYGRIYYGNLKMTNCTVSDSKIIEKDIVEFFKNTDKKDGEVSDYFLYTELTELGEPFKWYEDIKKAISNPKCKYISFDVFDTLVVRPFFYPTDLFSFLDETYRSETHGASHVWFSKIRIESESKMRVIKKQSGSPEEDVTIDEIYDLIGRTHSIEKSVLDGIKRKEKELEIQYCYARNTGKELYDLAIYLDKKIIMTSDMYLDKDTVNSILHKNGYTNYTLYLSSDVGLTKFTGNLYKYLIDNEGIVEPSSVCHIGDNWSSDVESPKKYGIQSFHLCKTTDMIRNYNPGIYSGELFKNVMYSESIFIDEMQGFNSFIGLRCMWAIVANKIYDNPYVCFKKDTDFNQDPFYVGYCALGMHMLGLTKWILKDQHGDGTIHFVARDGYLLKRFFEKYIEGSKQIKTNYLYLSRKSLLLADMSVPEDLYSIYRKMNVCNTSPRELLRILSVLLPEEKVKEVDDYFIDKYPDISIKFKNKEEYEYFLKLYIDLTRDILNFEIYKEKLRTMFSKVVLPGDYLFDVGYGGRSETALAHVLGYPINSYYVHTNSDTADIRSSDYGFTIKTFYDYKPSITGVMREHLMMKLAPSTIGYDFSSNDLKPIFEKYSIDYPSYIMTSIAQNAALEFCEDIKKIFGDDLDKMYARPMDLSMPFEYYLHSSKQLDRNIFANLTFEDSLGEGKTFNAVGFWTNDMNRIHSERGHKVIHEIMQTTGSSYIDWKTRINTGHRTIDKCVVSILNIMQDLYNKLLK